MLEGNEKELAMKILQVIMDDMGGMAAKKLMPNEASVDIAIAKPGLPDGMPEGTPEEEAAESPEEEKAEMDSGEGDEEDLSGLPRWKQRIKQNLMKK